MYLIFSSSAGRISDSLPESREHLPGAERSLRNAGRRNRRPGLLRRGCHPCCRGRLARVPLPCQFQGPFLLVRYHHHVAFVSPPVYYGFNEIACSGHSSTQVPQSTQASASTFAFSCTVIASTGHISAQVPHPVHFAVSMVIAISAVLSS